jgi:hypothetical protein
VFWRRKNRDDLVYRAAGVDPRYFIVQAHGQNFRHDELGLVGFYTTRPVSAPHEENALAQLRALIPVQLMPFGIPTENFILELTVVRETTLRESRRTPLSGFVFYSGP